MNLKTRLSAFADITLHLLKRPDTITDTFGFVASASRGLPRRDETKCTGCGACNERCSSGATSITDDDQGRTVSIDSLRCIFCARCADVCPEGALDLRAGTLLPDLSPDLCRTDHDPDIANTYDEFLSHSHGIDEPDERVDTHLSLQRCPVCGNMMPVTEKYLQVISERVLKNLQPETAGVVRKDMERYLTACISCRRKMSIEWDTHPRKFI